MGWFCHGGEGKWIIGIEGNKNEYGNGSGAVGRLGWQFRSEMVETKQIPDRSAEMAEMAEVRIAVETWNVRLSYQLATTILPR